MGPAALSSEFPSDFYDSVIDRNRIKLKFGMKMVENNSVGFLFLLLKEKVVTTSSSRSDRQPVDVQGGELRWWT